MRLKLDVAALLRAQGVKRSQIKFRPPRTTLAFEQNYYSALLYLLRGAQALVNTRVKPAALAVKRRLTQDAAEDNELSAALAALRLAAEYVLFNATERLVNRVLALEGQRHTKRWVEIARATLGIDLRSVLSQNDLADEFALMAQRNANLIRGLSEETIRRIEQATINSVLRGGTQKDLEDQFIREFGLLRKRARLLARDQTSKLTADLNKLRQQQLGIDEYTWSTARDERVRKTHEPLEGKVCRWDDPSVYRNPDESTWKRRSGLGAVQLHPGEDYQCRCVAIAVINLQSR